MLKSIPDISIVSKYGGDTKRTADSASTNIFLDLSRSFLSCEVSAISEARNLRFSTSLIMSRRQSRVSVDTRHNDALLEFETCEYQFTLVRSTFSLSNMM